LPPAVTAVDPEALAELLAGVRRRLTLVDVFGTSPIGGTGSGESFRLIRDRRWSPAPEGGRDGDEILGTLPFFHSNIVREPAAIELRRRWRRDNAARIGMGSAAVRVVFVNDLAGPLDLPGTTRQLHTSFVPLSHEAAFREAVMFLLDGGDEVEVMWLAHQGGRRQRLVVEVCGLRQIPLWAMLDGVCISSGKLPQRTANELDRECERQLRQLTG
jgi:hypothetical protein